MDISPQEIFKERKSYNYVLNLASLGLTWFDIPKCGSSSAKRYLLSCSRGAPANLGFGVGHENWYYLFPEVKVDLWENYTMQPKKLLILRDPVKRIKSAYRHIYTQMTRGKKPLSEFLETEFLQAIQTPSGHVSNNHFKPQSWFYPEALLNDPNTLLWSTTEMNTLPAALSNFLGKDLIPSIPHQNSSSLNLGVTDVSDEDIRDILFKIDPRDFTAFEKARETVAALRI